MYMTNVCASAAQPRAFPDNCFVSPPTHTINLCNLCKTHRPRSIVLFATSPHAAGLMARSFRERQVGGSGGVGGCWFGGGVWSLMIGVAGSPPITPT
jgi:hypothetical protein